MSGDYFSHTSSYYARQQLRLLEQDVKIREENARSYEIALALWQNNDDVYRAIVPQPRPPYDYHHALNQRLADLKGPLVLPGANFIGPGNKVRQQIAQGVMPTNEADRAAMIHDLQYEDAKIQADVHDADTIAIKHMYQSAKDAPVTSAQHWHGLVGGTGLYLKRQFESLFGVVYPGNLPKAEQGTPEKRPPASAPSSQDTPPPTPKKQKVEDTRQPEPEEEQPPEEASPVADESMASRANNGTAAGIAGDNAGPLYIGQGHTPATHRIYTKKFMLESNGFAPLNFNNSNIFPGILDPANASNPTYVTTPLNCVDPDLLPWFMSAAEYESLPDFTIATKCRLKMKPLGYRIPFTTASSTAENANNSATLAQVVFGTGINHKLDGAIVKVNFNTDGVTPTSLNVTLDDITPALYTNVDCAALGHPVHINQYYVVMKNSYLNGQPHLMKHMTIVNLADVRGQEVASLEYDFKCAPLKYGRDCGYETELYKFGVGDLTEISAMGPETNDTGVLSPRNNQNRSLMLERAPLTPSHLTYNTRIEKASWIAQHNAGNSSIAPPVLSYGSLPLPSNFIQNARSYLPVIVDWELHTELECLTLTDFPFTGTAGPGVDMMFLTMPRNINPVLFGTTMSHPFMNGSRAYVRPVVTDAAVTKVMEERPQSWATIKQRTALFEEQHQAAVDLRRQRIGREIRMEIQ